LSEPSTLENWEFIQSKHPKRTLSHPGPKKAKSLSLKLVFYDDFLPAFKIRFSGQPQQDTESTSPDQVSRLGFTLGGLGSTLVLLGSSLVGPGFSFCREGFTLAGSCFKLLIINIGA